MPAATWCIVRNAERTGGLAARGLRANGITQRELDLMYKVNPAKLLGLPPPDEAAILPAQARVVR